MKESEQRHITLKINASEEVPLVDLLNFMYKNTLSATTTPELLSVLKVADKFEVTSCVRYCNKLLKKIPFSLESVHLYLELPEFKAAQPLIDAAKMYLIEAFRDFSKSQEMAMKLPLSGIEIVLGINLLQVNSEDDMFDFILKWARAHYPNTKRRKKVLSNHLARFIYFPYMSSEKLDEALACPDFVPGKVSKLVHFNTGFRQGTLLTEDTLSSNGSLIIQRIYKYHPLKVVQLESTPPRCVVYLDLTKNELMHACLYYVQPTSIDSQSFCLGGKSFYLSAKSFKSIQKKFYMPDKLGLYLETSTKGEETCTVDFEFSKLKKSSMIFEKEVVHPQQCDIGSNEACLLGILRPNIKHPDPKYLVKGIMHLRVEITLINKSQA